MRPIYTCRKKFAGLPDWQLFARNFRLQFSVGVAYPQFWWRGGRRGSGMVPFERALMSFYRPSIVTFPLSLRVSEILPLMFSRTPLFHYPTSSLPKFPHVPLGLGGSFLATKSEGAWLIDCTISFQDFQPMWSQSTNVTDGRTDGRHAMPRPRICTKVHCAVNTSDDESAPFDQSIVDAAISQ